MKNQNVRILSIIGLLALLVVLLSAVRAFGTDVLVRVGDITSGVVSNRLCTITLVKPTGPVISGDWIVAGDSKSLITGVDGRVTFHNVLTGGSYRLDIAGNPPRSFPFSLGDSTGTVNVIDLMGQNNSVPMFYDTSQVDALIAAAGGGGGGGSTLPVRVEVEGDSLSSYNPMVGTNTWPTLLMKSPPFPGQRVLYTNWAHQGDTAVQMASQYATEGHTVLPAAGQVSWFILLAGLNDIGGGASAQTTFNALSNIWWQARADGKRVLACTVTPSLLFTSPQSVELASLNAKITGATNMWDTLAPLASYFNSDDVADNIHWTTNAVKKFATIIAQAISGYPHGVYVPEVQVSGVNPNFGPISIGSDAGPSTFPSLYNYVPEGVLAMTAGWNGFQINSHDSAHTFFKIDGSGLITGNFDLPIKFISSGIGYNAFNDADSYPATLSSKLGVTWAENLVNIWAATNVGVGMQAWGVPIGFPGGITYNGNAVWKDIPNEHYKYPGRGVYWGFGPQKASVHTSWPDGLGVGSSEQPGWQIVNANPWNTAYMAIRVGMLHNIDGRCELKGQDAEGNNVWLPQYGLSIQEIGEGYRPNGTDLGAESQQAPSHNIINDMPSLDLYYTINHQRTQNAVTETYNGQAPLWCVDTSTYGPNHPIFRVPLQVLNAWMPKNPNWKDALLVDELTGDATVNRTLTASNVQSKGSLTVGSNTASGWPVSYSWTQSSNGALVLSNGQGVALTVRPKVDPTLRYLVVSGIEKASWGGVQGIYIGIWDENFEDPSQKIIFSAHANWDDNNYAYVEVPNAFEDFFSTAYNYHIAIGQVPMQPNGTGVFYVSDNSIADDADGDGISPDRLVNNTAMMPMNDVGDSQPDAIWANYWVPPIYPTSGGYLDMSGLPAAQATNFVGPGAVGQWLGYTSSGWNGTNLSGVSFTNYDNETFSNYLLSVVDKNGSANRFFAGQMTKSNLAIGGQASWCILGDGHIYGGEGSIYPDSVYEMTNYYRLAGTGLSYGPSGYGNSSIWWAPKTNLTGGSPQAASGNWNIGRAKWLDTQNAYVVTNGQAITWADYGTLNRPLADVFVVVIICEPTGLSSILIETNHGGTWGTAATVNGVSPTGQFTNSVTWITNAFGKANTAVRVRANSASGTNVVPIVAYMDSSLPRSVMAFCERDDGVHEYNMDPISTNTATVFAKLFARNITISLSPKNYYFTTLSNTLAVFARYNPNADIVFANSHPYDPKHPNEDGDGLSPYASQVLAGNKLRSLCVQSNWSYFDGVNAMGGSWTNLVLRGYATPISSYFPHLETSGYMLYSRLFWEWLGWAK